MKHKEAEKSFLKYYLWRMLLLFAIGLAHALIWPGDVVHYYAWICLFVIPFRKIKPNKILAASIVVFIISISIGLGSASMNNDEKTPKEQPLANMQFEGVSFFDLKHKIQEEGISGMWYFNKKQYKKLYSLERLRTSIPNVIGLFLLGMFLFAKNLISEKMYNWKFLLAFLIAGLIGKYLMFYVSFQLRIIENLFMSLFFISLLGIIYKSGWGKKLLSFFHPVGKMAFTNYILQSIFATFIFYGIGLGLFAEIPYYGIYLIAFGILFIQTLFSHFWLKHFKFGPVEWFWRTLSYNKDFSLNNRRKS